MKETNYTYIVKCADGTFYTGWTNCIEKRLADHNSGKGAKYTKPRLPVELVYLEIFPTKQMAMSREAEIKKLTRSKKGILVAEYQKKRLSLTEPIPSVMISNDMDHV